MKGGGISEYNESPNINKRASSALRNYDLNSFDITLPTFGKPLSISLNTAKIVREFQASDDWVNPKSLGAPSDRTLITFLRRIHCVLEGQPLSLKI